jgi:hypothetical protein
MAEARCLLLSLPIEILEFVASFSGSGILNLGWIYKECKLRHFVSFDYDISKLAKFGLTAGRDILFRLSPKMNELDPLFVIS